ncbi:MAG: gluconeogenesis factor YvcK family protein [Bacillota bacterium]
MKRRYMQLLYPGMHIKRWLLLALVSLSIASFGLGLFLNYNLIMYVEGLIFSYAHYLFGWPFYSIVQFTGLLIFCLGVVVTYFFVKRGLRNMVYELLPGEHGHIIDNLFKGRRLRSGPKIVAIGGGTGLSVLLRGLKSITANITAIVTVADDGGSSGALREQLHIVPPGDMRNCMVALSDAEPLMERIMQHRFDSEGALGGHSLGNLFIAALAKELGDIELAMEAASKLLKINGKVIPSTKQNIRLCAEMADGEIVVGESKITKAGKKIHRVFLDTLDVNVPASAIDAVLNANIIIFGPGSLYTSIIPNLLLGQLTDAIKRSSAAKIYICNVMTQSGETDGYSASDHVQAILDHAGKVVEYVVVNNREVIQSLKELYAGKKAFPVLGDIDKIRELGVIPVEADIICETNYVRHDHTKLPDVIIELVYGILGKNKRRFWDKFIRN